MGLGVVRPRSPGVLLCRVGELNDRTRYRMGNRLGSNTTVHPDQKVGSNE